ncbi:MAG: hypothetical protein IKD43_03390 [Clostridia bacterium]|nr:hypothetical protein [Clostridia bacterium]
MCKGFAVYLKHFHTPHARLLRPFGFSEFYPREEPSPCVLKGKRFSEFSEGKGANADELFRHAVDESILRIYAFMNAFNGGKQLPEELFSVHMLTGKRI